MLQPNLSERGCISVAAQKCWLTGRVRREVAKRVANFGNDRGGKHVSCHTETLMTVEKGEEKVYVKTRKKNKEKGS